MSIDSKLTTLRVRMRENSKLIIDNINKTYIVRNPQKTEKKLFCSFCGSLNNITKEHVLPKWTYQNNPYKFFTTNINELSQTYNSATIPACSECNNELLSELELYINSIFGRVDFETTFFINKELCNIITWLEIIDYKFQVLEVKRRFLTSKSGGFIPYLKDFPISVFRKGLKDNPVNVVSEIRSSLKRITVKGKQKNINSLLIFKSINRDFYFFHIMNHHIFLELPQYNMAIFYFYNKRFSSGKQAQSEGMRIINESYQT